MEKYIDKSTIFYTSTLISVFVLLFYIGSIHEKDVWADSVIGTINVGTAPVGVAYDSNDGRVYIANQGSNTVSVIN